MTDQPDYPIDMISRARQLRQQASPIEDRVWGFLRNGHLDGLKFRRQHPLGRYVADFYCHAHQLVIEIDGPSHNDQEEHDHGRTLWLNQNGYRVIRFTNHDVLSNPNGMREAIREACRGTGPLTRRSAPTSPKGRGEQATSSRDGIEQQFLSKGISKDSSANIEILPPPPSTTCSPPPQGEVVPRPKGAGTGEGTLTTARKSA